MIAAFALVALSGLPRGHAQVPTTVGPRAAPAPGPAPAPAPAPAPVQQPVFIPVPEGTVIQQQPAEEDTGFFYLPEDFVNPGEAAGFEPGPAPQIHVVRTGDTLWDICFLYFNNPWEWPRIWSYNPEITNPHWIYPGDRVRLYPDGQGPIGTAGPSDAPGDVEGEEPAELSQIDAERPARPSQDGVRLRQLTFVDQDTREAAFTIVGAVEERTMLSEGDSVYLEYPSKRPPEEGKRYTIYAETSPVRHPNGQQIIGSYARILGELQVVSVREGKRARAFITDSVDVIERGNKVGTLQRTFRTVGPQRNQVDLQGTIVALVGEEQLIGQNQVVFIDKGKDDGLQVGNRMFVVRRGDALESPRSANPSVGQDDRRFPARAIGEIMIVEAGKRVSTALVTLALREFGVGDGVMMRKSAE